MFAFAIKFVSREKTAESKFIASTCVLGTKFQPCIDLLPYELFDYMLTSPPSAINQNFVRRWIMPNMHKTLQG